MDERKPELRYNLVTGDWVVIAPERGRRSTTAHSHSRPVHEQPAYIAACPFCRGNERETAAETSRVDGDDGWLVRAVENRYPALSSVGEVTRAASGYERSIAGVGRHEVVIESPYHNTTISLLDPARVRDVLAVYRERMRLLYADPRIEHVMVFKNHGETAGSTVDHPHSQIVGTPVVPGRVRVRIEEALRLYGELGECLYCYSLRDELASGVRIVEETECFAAFVPYAALSPYHVWIFPKRHGAYFGAVTDDELEGLAGILQRTLRRIYVALGDAHFNYVFRSLSPPEQHVKYYHWYVSVIVRITRAAGFELGTGMFINTAVPEESARLLREAKLEGG